VFHQQRHSSQDTVAVAMVVVIFMEAVAEIGMETADGVEIVDGIGALTGIGTIGIIATITIASVEVIHRTIIIGAVAMATHIGTMTPILTTIMTIVIQAYTLALVIKNRCP
jgi:hypothetical protein